MKAPTFRSLLTKDTGVGCNIPTPNSLMKILNDIVEDIYNLFNADVGPQKSKDQLSKAAHTMGRNIANLCLDRFEEYKQESRIRPSNIGKPGRQLWYELKNYPKSSEPSGSDYIKFLYGNILEELLLFLSYSAGHTVTETQKKVTIDGISGHKDCRIDGITVDIKSASAFAFKKFEQGTLENDDPFGYISQLSAYAKAEGDNEAAFFVIDKQSGKLALLPLHQMEMHNVSEKIKNIKKSLEKDEPPEKCYDTVPFGKSGNSQLSIGCRFCSYKHNCWADANNGDGLRIFNYANGPVYLTKVVNTPAVEEIT